MGTNGRIAVGKQQKPAINTNGSISHKCRYSFRQRRQGLYKPTQTKCKGTHNCHPKNYYQVEFFCNILQLNPILT